MLAEFRTATFTQNPAAVQLLGLCPLLAVSSTVINGIGLSLASLFVVVGSALVTSSCRSFIPENAKLPLLVLVIATFTTITTLVLEAFAFGLYTKIALFVQIIVTNCMVLARLEQFASKNRLLPSLGDALGTGVGFAIALIGLGCVREILGNGTLMAGAESLFGPEAASWQVTVTELPLVPLASYAPGAFIVAGLVLMLINWQTARKDS